MTVSCLSLSSKSLSLLKYFVLSLNLVALGCASAPNLLYVGADSILEYPFVRKAAAEQDYPIVVTTAKGQDKVEIRWTYRGDWIWGETPFAKAHQVQFKLFKPGMSDVLCDSGPITDGRKTYDCMFNVGNYTSEPLAGELNYWFMDKPGADDPPSIVLRTYYLIEQPKPTK